MGFAGEMHPGNCSYTLRQQRYSLLPPGGRKTPAQHISLRASSERRFCPEIRRLINNRNRTLCKSCETISNKNQQYRRSQILLRPQEQAPLFKGFLREHGREAADKQEHKVQKFRKCLFTTCERGGETNRATETLTTNFNDCSQPSVQEKILAQSNSTGLPQVF